MATLQTARGIAEELLREMRPFCERAEIAGSIRREKSEVKDIELVVIPRHDTQLPAQFASDKVLAAAGIGPDDAVVDRTGEEQSLFAALLPPKVYNWLYLWAQTQCLVEWIKPGTPEIVPWKISPDGKYWRGITEAVEGEELIKLDCFIANRDNWGSIMTIRTGSAQFSNALLAFIKNRTQYRHRDGFLFDETNGNRVPLPEERDLFELVGLDWIEPSERSGDNWMQRINGLWRKAANAR